MSSAASVTADYQPPCTFSATDKGDVRQQWLLAATAASSLSRLRPHSAALVIAFIYSLLVALSYQKLNLVAEPGVFDAGLSHHLLQDPRLVIGAIYCH